MSNSDPKTRPKPGPWPPASESSPMPPSSWAKRTGFRPKFSGETNASDSGQISLPPKPKEQPDTQPDLEAGRVRTTPPPPRPPAAVAPATAVNGTDAVVPSDNKDQTVKRRRDSDGGGAPKKESGHGANGQGPAGPPTEGPRRASRNEEVVDAVPQGVEDDGFVGKPSHMKYELRDSPGLGEFLTFDLVTVDNYGGLREWLKKSLLFCCNFLLQI